MDPNDIYRAAKLLIDRYGEDATLEAAARPVQTFPGGVGEITIQAHIDRTLVINSKDGLKPVAKVCAQRQCLIGDIFCVILV